MVLGPVTDLNFILLIQICFSPTDLQYLLVIFFFLNSVWWLMLIISIPRRQRQEDCYRLNASLGHIVRHPTLQTHTHQHTNTELIFLFYACCCVLFIPLVFFRLLSVFFPSLLDKNMFNLFLFLNDRLKVPVSFIALAASHVLGKC